MKCHYCGHAGYVTRPRTEEAEQMLRKLTWVRVEQKPDELISGSIPVCERCRETRKTK